MGIIQSERWGIEFRRPGSRVWLLLGTLPSEKQANVWMLRFFGTGDYRIRRPIMAGVRA